MQTTKDRPTRRYLWLVLATGLWCIGVGLGPAAAAVPQQSITDNEITLAIENELLTDEMVPEYLIDVSTIDGVVTLTGTASNLLAKDRAAQLARTVKGVRSVINRINVEPGVAFTDEELENMVRAALAADPATDSYELAVKVRDGVVRLSGTVDSHAERRLSQAVVKSVKGVREVRPELEIEYKTERSDYEIETEVESRLKADPWVADALITADVQDGVVTLTGTVGSAEEKQRARNDAWVMGVKDVDHSGLDIEWWARKDMERDKYTVSSDERIERAVKDSFLYDPRVSAFKPEVTVRGGVVTLTGVVDNVQAKRAAEEDARNTLGVWRVRNFLKVRPDHIPSDDELELRVRNAIERHPTLDAEEVQVSADRGSMHLMGTVDYEFQRVEAADVAGRVNGVVNVFNHLDVGARWAKRPDWEIKHDIQEELWWSPWVDSDDVDVTVEGGVAVLTGTVDSWQERSIAAANAIEGGAKRVRNQLKVEFKPDFDLFS